MNFDSDSDSGASDTPIHNLSIRLADIGKVDASGNENPSRYALDEKTMESKRQLNAALHKIDGSPSQLQRAIDMEQRKILFGQSSMQKKNKLKRAPPRPPADARTAVKQKENRPPPKPPKENSIKVPARRALQFHNVDYTLITSPESISSTRRCLSRLVNREKVIQKRDYRSQDIPTGLQLEAPRVNLRPNPQQENIDEKPHISDFLSSKQEGAKEDYNINSSGLNLGDVTRTSHLHAPHLIENKQIHGHNFDVINSSKQPEVMDVHSSMQKLQNMASLTNACCDNILAAPDIAQVVNQLTSFFNDCTVKQNLGINEWSIWVYDSTKHSYESYSKNEEIKSLQISEMMEILQNFSSERCQSFPGRDHAFPKLIRNLIPRYSSPGGGEDLDDILSDYEFIHCVKLPLVNESVTSTERGINAGVLVLGEWTSEKCKMSLHTKSENDPASRSVNTQRQARHLDAEKLHCVSEVCEKLRVSVYYKLHTLRLFESSKEFSKQSLETTQSLKVAKYLHSVNCAISRRSDELKSGEVIHSLVRAILKMGTEVLSVSASWLVLSDMDTKQFYIFSENNAKDVKDYAPFENVASESIHVCEEQLDQKGRSIMGSIIDDTEVDGNQPLLRKIPLENLVKSGLTTKSYAETLAKKTRDQFVDSDSANAVWLLIAPFAFHGLQNIRGTIILTLCTYEHSNASDRQCCIENQRMLLDPHCESMVNCFIHNVQQVRYAQEQHFKSNMECVSSGLWNQFIECKKRKLPEISSDATDINLTAKKSMPVHINALCESLSDLLPVDDMILGTHNIFRSHRAQLLLTNSLLETLSIKSSQVEHEVEDNNADSFISYSVYRKASNEEGMNIVIDRHHEQHHGIYGTDWLDTLKAGKTIIVSARLMSDANCGLSRFIRNVDQDAKSALLLPLRVGEFTSILLLPDVEDVQKGGKVTANDLQSLLFPLAESFVFKESMSRLVETISKILDASCHECKLINAKISDSHKIIKLRKDICVEYQKCDTYERRYQMLQSFGAWKMFTQLNKRDSRTNSVSIQTVATREAASCFRALSDMGRGDSEREQGYGLLDHTPQRVSSGHERFERFVGKIRRCVSAMFPDDIVVVQPLTNDSDPQSSSLSKGARSNEIRGVVSPVHGKEGQQVVPKVEIRILRSPSSLLAFLEWEIEALNTFCCFATVIVYEVLLDSHAFLPVAKVRDGNTQTMPKVEKQSQPIIPFLNEALPSLLSANNNIGVMVEENEARLDVTTFSSIIIRWLNVMCNAEVTFLRAKPRADKNVSIEELLLSSDDCDPNVRSKETSLSECHMEACGSSINDFVDMENCKIQKDSKGKSELTLPLPALNGELKLYGRAMKDEVDVLNDSKSGFSDADKGIAAIAAYILTISTLHHKNMQQSSLEKSRQRNDIERLNEHEKMLTSRLADETQISEHHMHQVDVMVALCRLQVQVLQAQTQQDLCDTLFDILSKSDASLLRDWLGIQSAVLFVRHGSGEDAVFLPLKPSSYDSHFQAQRLLKYKKDGGNDAGLSDASENTINFNKGMTLSDLRKYSLFGKKLNSSKSKEVMFLSNDSGVDVNSVKGAILFSFGDVDSSSLQTPTQRKERCEFDKELMQVMLNRSFLTVLHRTSLQQELSDCSKQCVDLQHKCDLNARIEDELQGAQSEVSRLNEELASLEQEKDSLEKRMRDDRVSYSAEIDTMQHEVDSMIESHKLSKSNYEAMVESSREESIVRASEADMANDSLCQMESLISSFAVDSRLDSCHIRQWLAEVAESKGAYVEFVQHDEAGGLALHKGGTGMKSSRLEQLDDSVVLSVARGCVRDGETVEMTSFINPRLLSAANKQDSEMHVTILCVPNRLSRIFGTLAPSAQDTFNFIDNICIAFIRLGNSEFTRHEKSYLTSAAGIASKCYAMSKNAGKVALEQIEKKYMHSKYPMSTLEFENLLSNFEESKVRLGIIRNTIEYSNKIWRTSFRTWVELFTVAESAVRHILEEICQGHSGYSTDVVAWHPELTTQGGAPRFVNMTLSDGVSTVGTVAQRVFSTGTVQRSENLLWLPLKSHAGEVVCVFCCEKKFNFHKDAFRDNYRRGIEEKSLEAAEEGKVNLMFTLHEEELLRLLCTLGTCAVDRLLNHKDALQSMQQASKAIIRLQENVSHLENKLANSLSQKLKVEESMQLGCSLMSGVFKRRTDFLGLLENLRNAMRTACSSIDCLVLTSVSPLEVNDAMPKMDSCTSNTREPKKYYYFDEMLGKEKVVVLSNLDIEYMAMDSRRILKTKSASSTHHGEDDAGDATSPISSWTFRNNINNSALVEPGTYALALPYSIGEVTSRAADNETYAPSGGIDVVVTLLRKKSDFDDIDELCSSFLIKTFNWGAQFLFAESSQQISQCGISGTEAQSASGGGKDYDAKRKEVPSEGDENEFEKTFSSEQALSDTTAKVPCFDADHNLHMLIKNFSSRFDNKDIPLLSSCFVQWVDDILSALNQNSLDTIEVLQGHKAPPNDQLNCWPALTNSSLAEACLHSIFGPQCLVSVSCGTRTSSTAAKEREHYSEASFFMELDQNMSGKANKDSFFVGPMKVLCWKENGKEEHGSPILEAVILHSSLERPLWVSVKVKPDEPFVVSKFNLMIAAQWFYLHHVELEKIKQMMQSMQSNHFDFIVQANKYVTDLEHSHDQRITKQRSDYDMRIIDLEKRLTCREEDTARLEKERDRHAMDSKNSHEACQSYFIHVSIAADMILNFYLSSKDGKKRTNLSRLFRKVCESFSSLLEVSVAVVVDEGKKLHPSNTKEAKSKAHGLNLSWVAGNTQWIGSSSKRYDDTGHINNPILRARALHRSVVVADDDEFAESLRREFGLEHFGRSSIQEGKEFVIMTSTLVPKRTIIIPLKLPHRREEAIVVVQPNVENKKFPVSLHMMLKSWMFLCSCLESVTSQEISHFKAEEEKKSHDAYRLCQKLDKVKFRKDLQSKSRAFFMLYRNKQELARDKWKRKFSIEHGKVSRLHEHLRELERSVADWTELIKGINRSSDGLADGLPGLWGHACRSLVQLITAHVVLDGCGLMVATPDSEILDLDVTELLPVDYVKPVPDTQYPLRAADLNDDMAPADINIRLASELGPSVHSLVQDIFADVTPSISSRQKLWKLTKKTNKDETSEHCEQMWLVPIKTTTEVLGVLRVAVVVPIAGDTASSSLFQHSKRSSRSSVTGHDNEVYRYDEEDSEAYTNMLLTPPTERTSTKEYSKKQNSDAFNIECAKRNLVNFTEVFAPLVAAARKLDDFKSKNLEAKDALQSFEQRNSTLLDEIRRNSRLMHFYDHCIVLFGSTLYEDMLEHGVTQDPDTTLQRRLKEPLEMIRREFQHDFDSAYLFESNELGEGFEPVGGMWSEEMILHGKQILSEAIFTEMDRYDQFEMQVSKVGNFFSALAMLVSGVHASLLRESNAKHEVTTAVENLHSLQHRLEDEMVLKESISEREIAATESSEFNRMLVEVMEVCLSCVVDDLVKASALLPKNHSLISERAQHSLSRLSSMFASMFKECNAVFKFAISNSHVEYLSSVHGDESSANPPSGDNMNDIRLLWFSSSDINDENTSTWPTLNQPSLQICKNLAIACLSEGQKSCVDIESSERVFQQDEYSPTGLDIMSVPIFATALHRDSAEEEEIVIGVIQVTLPNRCQRKQEISGFCEAIGRTIGCVLDFDVQRIELLKRFSVDESANYVLQSTVSDLSSENKLLQQKAHFSESALVCLKSVLQDCESLSDNQEGGIFPCLKSAANQILSRGILLHEDGDGGAVDKEQYEFACSIRLRMYNSQEDNVSMSVYFDKTLGAPVKASVCRDAFDCVNEAVNYLNAIALSKRASIEHASKKMTKLLAKVDKVRKERDRVAGKLSDTVGECNLLAREVAGLQDELASQSSSRKGTSSDWSRALNFSIQLLKKDILHLFEEGHLGEFREASKANSVDMDVDAIEMVYSRFARSIFDALSHSAACLPGRGDGINMSKSMRNMHVSVLVTSTREYTSAKTSVFDGNVVMFDGRSVQGTPLSNVFERKSDDNENNISAISKCFHSGTAHLALQLRGSEAHDESCKLLPGDVSGTSLSLTSGNVVMMVLPLLTCAKQLDSVIRILFEYDADDAESDAVLMHRFLVLRSFAEQVSSLGVPVSKFHHRHSELKHLEAASLKHKEHLKHSIENANASMSSVQKLQKQLCREALSLMDPPIAGIASSAGGNLVTNHPASLPPVMALQDTSMKVLSIARTVLKSEGQALFLHNPNTNPSSFQVIYTGNAISWVGMEQGRFGLVSSSAREDESASSLVETVMKSRKSCCIDDVASDPRYSPNVDGSCPSKSPMIIVPVRGRSGGVVGTLVAVREQDSAPFSQNDVVAFDLLSAFSSISLYWGQGVGYMHDKLSKSMAKLESLEKAVSSLRNHQ